MREDMTPHLRGLRNEAIMQCVRAGHVVCRSALDLLSVCALGFFCSFFWASLATGRGRHHLRPGREEPAGRRCGAHPGVGQPAAGVEGRQEPQPQVLGHVQQLVLVPQHVTAPVPQQHSHGVPPQQAPGGRRGSRERQLRGHAPPTPQRVMSEVEQGELG